MVSIRALSIICPRRRSRRRQNNNELSTPGGPPTYQGCVENEFIHPCTNNQQRRATRSLRLLPACRSRASHARALRNAKGAAMGIGVEAGSCPIRHRSGCCSQTIGRWPQVALLAAWPFSHFAAFRLRFARWTRAATPEACRSVRRG